MNRALLCLPLVAATLYGCEERSGAGVPFGPRNVVSERWDTVFMAGGDTVNDTLFAGPHRIALADGVVIVGDDMVARLIALDRETGRVRWTFGREGGGPEEFRGISDVSVSPEGRIWVVDYGNGRISEISADGTPIGIRPLHHLPATPGSILPLEDRVIAMSQRAEEPFMELDPNSLEVRTAYGLSWPEPVSERVNTHVWLGGRGDTWVSAFWLGPGFTVWQDGAPRSHYFREPIPWALRPSPEIRRMGADSARFGAVSLDVVDDEIFILFGGRPVRRPHPGEPTVWIDVYALDGGYDRSYHLPFDTHGMATDGRTFYLLPSEGVPRVVALRPAGQ
jgi:6-bladed beta-propeller